MCRRDARRASIRWSRCDSTDPLLQPDGRSASPGPPIYFPRLRFHSWNELKNGAASEPTHAWSGSARDDIALPLLTAQKQRLGADGLAEGVGYGCREALDVGIVFGFNHHAREGLGAGVAEDHAAVFTEGGLRFREGTRDFGKGFKGRLGFDLHVDDDLRVVLQTEDERLQSSAHGNERRDFQGREQSVAGGRILEKNDVAGLFAAEDVVAAQHFFEDISVADGGAAEFDAFTGEHTLESKIGHGGGDHAVAFEFALRFEEARGGQEHPVAIDDFPGGGNEQRAVGIAVKGHTERGAFGNHTLLQLVEMQRAATGVNIAAVGLIAHGDYVGAQRLKKLGGQSVGGAVGAIEDHAQAGKLGAGNDAAAQKLQVIRVQGFIGSEGGRISWRRLGAVLKDV